MIKAFIKSYNLLNFLPNYIYNSYNDINDNIVFIISNVIIYFHSIKMHSINHMKYFEYNLSLLSFIFNEVNVFI